MKRPDPKTGKSGLIAAGFGTALTLVAAALVSRSFPLALGLLIAGGIIYLLGGIVAVSVYGYRRGSKLYLTLMGFRLVFVLGVMLTILQLVTKPA